MLLLSRAKSYRIELRSSWRRRIRMRQRSMCTCTTEPFRKVLPARAIFRLRLRFLRLFMLIVAAIATRWLSDKCLCDPTQFIEPPFNRLLYSCTLSDQLSCDHRRDCSDWMDTLQIAFNLMFIILKSLRATLASCWWCCR